MAQLIYCIHGVVSQARHARTCRTWWCRRRCRRYSRQRSRWHSRWHSPRVARGTVENGWRSDQAPNASKGDGEIGKSN